MPSTAEPHGDISSGQTPLTARALDQLNEQVAADAEERPIASSAASPDFVPHLPKASNKTLASNVNQTPRSKSSSREPNISKDLLTHSDESSTFHNTLSSQQPISLHRLQDPSAPVPLMTDYVVDGTIYRSPDTLNTLITIGPTATKGLAVFALRDLPPHTLVLSERPLVALNDDGARADPLDALVNALPPALKRAYRSLHGYSPSTSTDKTSTKKNKVPRESLNRRVLYSNGFAIERTTTAVFEVASRINHSCVPNARFRWDAEAGRMDYYTVTKVLEGEEVCIDYGHTKGRLLKYYGFECGCGGCTEWGSVTSSGGPVSEGGTGTDVRLVQTDGLWRPVEVAEISTATTTAAAAAPVSEEKAHVRGHSTEMDELEKENLRPENQRVST